jgi:hypothetical protein
MYSYTPDGRASSEVRPLRLVRRSVAHLPSLRIRKNFAAAHKRTASGSARPEFDHVGQASGGSWPVRTNPSPLF